MSDNNNPRFLNLGCGASFSQSPEWLNMDVAPHDEKFARQYELGLGIPFADGRFEAVYHSHLLEHFPRSMAPAFLRECWRVLRPGGILRVVVPDLEGLARQYLAALDEARAGQEGARDRHLWMQVELLDQLVRKKSGGAVAAAWSAADDNLAAFIKTRVGGELENIPRKPRSTPLKLPEEPLALPVLNTNFLVGGELHQWMYDEASLKALLEEAGFEDIKVVACNDSEIPNFTLDANADGASRKPDSIYMEAKKPFREETVECVPIISASDKGGAGIAAMRLHHGLRKSGFPSISYTQHKQGAASQVYVLPPPPGQAVLPDGYGGAYLSSLRENQARQASSLAPYPNRVKDWETFSPSDAAMVLADIPLLAEAKIIHLHWVARFMDIPRNADFLKDKKIIWTLHDMNPFTGGCHYARGCDKYADKCGNCPQLASGIEKDLAYRSWQRKFYAFRKLDINVVAPSKWLVREASRSSLLGQFPVHHIPYGIETDIFKPYDRKAARQMLCLEQDAKILLFSADGVLNGRKGFVYLLNALAKIHDHPAVQNLQLAIMGSGSEELTKLPYKIKALGNINDQHTMAAVYSAADALVLPTLEDNLPNVLLESLSCGTPAVSFNVGGVPDIVDHAKNGWLAEPQDVDSLAQNLLLALNDTEKTRRILCRTKVLENFPMEKMVENYKKLYEAVLKQ